MREKKFKEREIESYTRSVYDIRKCLVLQNHVRPLVIEANKKEMILKKFNFLIFLISTDAHKMVSFDGTKPKNTTNGLNSPALQDNSFKLINLTSFTSNDTETLPKGNIRM